LNTLTNISTQNLKYNKLSDETLVRAYKSLEVTSDSDEHVSICSSTNTIYKDINTRLQKVYGSEETLEE